MSSGNFIENPARVYRMYTLGFVVFVLLMALLERIGVSTSAIGILFITVTVVIYACAGWFSKTSQVDTFYVAGREVPPLYNGLAMAADWIPGAVFIALAGGIYFDGHSHLAFVIGWTGGYVLVNSLIAPYLRKSGCYTVPDFFGMRYGGSLPRLFSAAILVVISFVYLTAQINATGVITARALLIPFEYGVWLALAGIFMCSVLGGMRAVTLTQAAQYIVLIIAYVTPVVWMSNNLGFGFIPHFSYGEAISRIGELESILGVGTPAAEVVEGMKVLTTLHNDPGTGLSTWKFVTLAICMMTGVASLPHVLMHCFTTPSVRDARRSVTYSLIFIFLLYFTAPALATLSRLQLLDPEFATHVIGKAVAQVQSLEWIQRWSEAGFVAIRDSNGDGVVQINEFFMHPDVVTLAIPEIAGLPYVISALVAAGGLAAAMSTASGLLLAIANSLSHDVYYKIFAPLADARKRLLVARVLLIGMGMCAALVVTLKLAGVLEAVAWTFCLAASGLFFPLVLGIWWKRANKAGALAGMVVGFGSGLLYLYYVQTGGTPFWGLDGLRFGIVGMSANLIAMITVTLGSSE